MIRVLEYKKYLPWLVIVVMGAILMLRGRTAGDKLYIESLHSKIESLESNISQLEGQNRIIASNIEMKIDSINYLKDNLQEIENKRLAAIKYYRGRIKEIESLSTNELDSLFIKRYGNLEGR